MSEDQRGDGTRFWLALKRWSIRALVATALAVLLGAIVVGGVLFYYNQGLPPLDTLANYAPPQATRLLDRQGAILAEFADEKRTVVAFERIPGHVRNAFLAAEDADFYKHGGLDFAGLLRAFWANLRAGKVVQGGSTITQQVIKTFLLGPERSYSRKIRELLLAFRLESNLTKDEILFLYLNQIYFGHGCYGVQEASLRFFRKSVEELTLAEGAVLASLPKSPARYSPCKHPENTLKRRNWVLEQMLKHDMIAAADAQTAESAPVSCAPSPPGFFEQAPYFSEHVRRMLEDKLGRDRLYQGGLRVEVTLDLEMQRAARAAMNDGLRAVDRKQGYRGPQGRISEQRIAALHSKIGSELGGDQVWTLMKIAPRAEDGADPKDAWQARPTTPGNGVRLLVPVVSVAGEGPKAVAEVDLGSCRGTLTLDSVRWARRFGPVKKTPQPTSVTDVLAIGDVIEVELAQNSEGQTSLQLGQPPLVQGALVAIDPETRDVLAMIGGSDFNVSPLIRSVQSVRQPGSAFKPIVYATALQEGLVTPATVVMDTPETYRSSLRGRAWKPQNYEREFRGPVSVRYALAHSINTVAVKLAADVGPQAIIRMAHALGIASTLQQNLSLALGSSEVTPLELTNAYATFAAGGLVDDPRFILRIVDQKGEEISVPDEEPRRAISPEVAFLVTSILRSVVEDGTGQKAKKLKRPVVGKTGTTNQQRDGWFVGYSADLACGVWVGFDDHSRMGHGWAAGSGTALPIWVQFMDLAHRNRPTREFRVPESILFVRVDPENGLLAPPGMPGARFDVFAEGSEPRTYSNRVIEGQAQSTHEPELNQLLAPEGRLPEGMFK